MENEPDDSQTMIHLLMYANEIDIESLIAVGSRWLPNHVFPESIHDRVKAYGIVFPNLQKHASGWPSEDYLLSKIAGGQIGYGMEGVGNGKSTKGSELIIQAVDKDDPRPVWVAINAGSNTLAQALWDACDRRSPEDLQKFIAKIRVYDDSGQDNAGAWMAHTFPDLFYIRSRSQIFGLFGPGFMTGPQPWATGTLQQPVLEIVERAHAGYILRVKATDEGIEWFIPHQGHPVIETGCATQHHRQIRTE
jgi:hypothetical protein